MTEHVHGWESPETDEEEVWEGHGINCGEVRCTYCVDNGHGFVKHLCRVFLNRLIEEVVRQTALEIASAAHARAKRTAETKARERTVAACKSSPTLYLMALGNRQPPLLKPQLN